MNFNKYHVSRNLFDGTLIGGIFQDANFTVSGSTTVYKSIKIYLTAGNYTLSWAKNVNIVRLIIDGTYTENVETDVMTYTFIINNSGYFGITFRDSTSSSTVWDNSPIMLNEGSQPLPYEPYGDSWHNISHYIHNTSTDTLTTLPADIYANDTTATVGLKGQMEQSGTPTPTTPIQPKECGEKTGNLFDAFTTIGKVPSISTGDLVNYPTGASSDFIPIGEPNITLSQTKDNTIYIMLYDENKAYIGYTGSKGSELHSNIISGYSSARFAKVRIDEYSQSHDNNLMLNTGSIALPYEPYGQYKIPILSAGQTTPIYLGEVQTTRKIKKLVLTGEEDFPVTNNCFVLWLNSGSYLSPKQELIYCTHYKGRTPTYRDSLNDGQCMITKNQNQIAIKDLTYATADDFKAYLQQQYQNNTPVTVWYVLAEPTTGIVNEPLCKIGTYADEVSAITIPVTAGANTISIDTTLPPSEVTVNYKGWHPVADVHEYENGQWD